MRAMMTRSARSGTITVMSTAQPKLEEAYRTLFNTMDEGFALCELVRNPQGNAIDYRILDANPSFAAHAGFTVNEVVGRLRSEIYPTPRDPSYDADVLAMCERVVATGEPARLEQYSPALDRWLNVRLFPHRGDQFTALFGDITERKRNEESQATLHSFYDTAPFLMGIGEIDGDTLVAVSANRKTAEFFARPAAAIPGCSGLELGTPPAVDALWLAHLRKSRREGIPVHFEYQDVRATGTAWLSVTVAIIGTGSSGRPQYSFIAEDIGERKQTESALRESEARFQAIANLVPDLLWSSGDGGITDWYNQRWLEYSGQAPAQALGDGWLAAVHPQDRETSVLRFRAAAARGEPLRHEHRLRSAAGEYRWHLVQMRPVRDAAGTIVRWFGAATDIHEQRVALEALRTSEELFRTLTNAVPQVIWANDAAGRAIYYNQRWYDYTGLDLAASAGLGWQAAVHPGDVAAAVISWQQAIAIGAMFQFEYRLRRHDGVYRWHLGRVVPLHDEHGEVTGWFGSSTDIEDIKQAEAALQAAYADLDLRVQERTAELRRLSQVRQDLLQRLVTIQEDERRRIARELHDSLGQFLSALNLRLSILEQTAGVASPVIEEIEQLRPAVQQIDRELERLTMELRPPALDDFGLGAALHNYVNAWARLANIRVDVYVMGLDAPEAPPDPGLQPGLQPGPRLAPEVETSVYRIVQEALNNVLKHAQATAVSVIVERRRTALNVIVEDNGVGFDPDSPDAQTAGGTIRRHLGLLGMQERAALAGGTVQIESAEGAGTTIYVQIPIPS